MTATEASNQAARQVRWLQETTDERCAAEALGRGEACKCNDSSAGIRACLEDAVDGKAYWSPCMCEVDSHAYMVNGQFTTDFAAVGALVQTGTDKQVCTASVIGPDTLLSAAHCDINQDLDFILGPHTSRPVKRVAVTSFVANPGYTGGLGGGVNNNQHDSAILKLATPIRTVKPLPLCTQSLAGFQGKPLSAIGYGVQAFKQPGDHRRQGGGFTVEAVIGHFMTFSFANNDLGLCSGDSGGPALYCESPEHCCIAGIASFVKGPDGDPCRGDAFHQRLDTQISWLASQNVRNRSEPATCVDDDICDGACRTDPDCQDWYCSEGRCEGLDQAGSLNPPPPRDAPRPAPADPPDRSPRGGLVCTVDPYGRMHCVESGGAGSAPSQGGICWHTPSGSVTCL